VITGVNDTIRASVGTHSIAVIALLVCSLYPVSTPRTATMRCCRHSISTHISTLYTTSSGASIAIDNIAVITEIRSGQLAAECDTVTTHFITSFPLTNRFLTCQVRTLVTMFLHTQVATTIQRRSIAVVAFFKTRHETVTTRPGSATCTSELGRTRARTRVTTVDRTQARASITAICIISIVARLKTNFAVVATD